MNELRFPVGRCPQPQHIDLGMINHWIETIDQFPTQLKEAVADLSEEQLEKAYRPESWTIRQLVHHLADSHMNAYIRFKVALTEKKPTIKPYEEALWAKQPDYEGPIHSSLSILEGVHARWAKLLRTLTPSDFEQTYIHPEFNDEYDLRESLCQYDWHCRHHLAHIQLAKTN